MRINTNMIALNTHRYLTNNTEATGKSVEKLSSGLRINRAADDAAGLSISEKMRSQIRGLNMATKNAQDGISLIQSAEGALNEYHAILQRGRELSVQSANGVNVQEDRDALDAEVQELLKELERIATTTQFNTMQLLDGTAGEAKDGELVLQVGANKDEVVKFNIGNMRLKTSTGSVKALTDLDGIDIKSYKTASEALDLFDAAVAHTSQIRSGLGAMQNRLEYTIKNITTVSENLSAAESRIRDVDMAKEMMSFTKNNILQQAATAMLAQANQLPQNVLQLLR